MKNARTSNETQVYWDEVYQTTNDELSWTLDEATASLNLIEQCHLAKTDPIVDVGSGTSVFIRNLLEKGFDHIIALDISEKALSKNQERLGPDAEQVQWLIDDVNNPQKLPEFGEVGLWHDRAFLHFLTDFRERLNYFALMNQMVREEGYVIIAAFNQEGPDRCMNLPVKRYDEEGLKSFMGPGYKLIESFNKTEKAPKGTEYPYIYALFQRIPHVAMG